jgi:two-component system response regulator PilR (NtrC family)
MHKAQALVVDDESDILDLLKITLGRMDIGAHTVSTLGEAMRALQQYHYDLCLTDMSLPDGNGIELIRYINERHPEVPVAMITAYGNTESAVAAMKAGAFDFVAKPVDLRLLRQLVGAALRLGETRGSAGASGPALIGDSPVMEQIRGVIAKLARNQAPVFITGESGTGKELAARLIHARGPRAAGPFVAVNCGAIPQDLIESELFGHKRGSFTGAVSDKDGLFQAASGGTLFLDEVADLPLPAQVKLLRAVQEKRVRPVGAQQEIPVDARIISASHRNLKREVEAGRFRQDLFYRINVIELRMPSLRERPRDIPALVTHILQRITGRGGDHAGTVLSECALEALMHYDFPGNVRELENILERATALCEGGVIGSDDLLLPCLDRDPPPDSRPDDPKPVPTEGRQPLEDYLGEIEKKAILDALAATHWNRTAAAKQLGMTLRALRYRLAKLGIDR